MSLDIETLGKRVMKLEADHKSLTKEINQFLREIAIVPKIELYYTIAREIKNEANHDILREYLFDNEIIKSHEEFFDYQRKHELQRTYLDENKNALELNSYFQFVLKNPPIDMSKLHYYSYSNAIIQKNRYEIKKKILMDKGYGSDYDGIKVLNEAIEDATQTISKLAESKVNPIEDREYYVKKENAEELYQQLFSSRDQIIERIREVPLINGLQLEPHSRLLYNEVIINYWIGNYNATICILSVLLESFLRDRYYLKEKKEYEDTLWPLINDCKTLDIITDVEKEQLLKFADLIRNTYLHANLAKIVPEVIVPAVKFSTADPSKKAENTYLTSDGFPFVRSMVKEEIDKDRSRELVINLRTIIEQILMRQEEIPSIE